MLTKLIYKPPQTELDVVHLDEDIIVLNKPSGLLSVPGKEAEYKDCLETRVRQMFPRVSTVHRLDMDTSGLIVMALHLDALRHLSKQFENRMTKKTYVCLVDGFVAEDEGSVDLPLRCDWPNRPLQMVDHEQGKKALTHWSVMDRFDEMTRLELIPVTGRSHQLRVHCLSMGHPIIGDRFYAPEDVVKKASRLCLHAMTLTIRHPRTGEELTLRTEVPF